MGEACPSVRSRGVPEAGDVHPSSLHAVRLNKGQTLSCHRWVEAIRAVAASASWVTSARIVA